VSGRSDPAAPGGDPAAGTEPLDPDEVDRDAAARGGLYSLLARGFRHPDEAFHAAAANGALAAEVRDLAATTSLDLPAVADEGRLGTDDDFETLCARYNDLFVIGFATYEDRTDGSLASEGPPVPLYESTYRPEASWGDVNLDLARAYEYFGLGVDQDDRDNHDALPLQLEFAAYLARREALGERGAAAARLDLLDRHLSYVAAGVCDCLEQEAGTDLYGGLGDVLAGLVQAEQTDLGRRRDDGEFAAAGAGADADDTTALDREGEPDE
jgi:DMSO reductase family type II enzyme chaperone